MTLINKLFLILSILAALSPAAQVFGAVQEFDGFNQKQIEADLERDYPVAFSIERAKWRADNPILDLGKGSYWKAWRQKQRRARLFTQWIVEQAEQLSIQRVKQIAKEQRLDQQRLRQQRIKQIAEEQRTWEHLTKLIETRLDTQSEVQRAQERLARNQNWRVVRAKWDSDKEKPSVRLAALTNQSKASHSNTRTRADAAFVAASNDLGRNEISQVNGATTATLKRSHYPSNLNSEELLTDTVLMILVMVIVVSLAVMIHNHEQGLVGERRNETNIPRNPCEPPAKIAPTIKEPVHDNQLRSINNWSRAVRSATTRALKFKQTEDMEKAIFVLEALDTADFEARRYANDRVAPNFSGERKLLEETIETLRFRISANKILGDSKELSESKPSDDAGPQTPVWVNTRRIADILAAKKPDQHTDYIVPLHGRYVSGLNWEGNLYNVADSITNTKGNSYWPDMWEYTHSHVAELDCLAKSAKLNLPRADYAVSGTGTN